MTSSTCPSESGTASLGRLANADTLAAALISARQDTLATFSAYQAALPALMVPQAPQVNPPLWELGHIGWFQEFWIARNPQAALGTAANPVAERRPGIRANGDNLYDSSKIPHDDRWALALPTAGATLGDLAAQLDHTLSALSHATNDDASLYFFRLALFHEDMHHEAALYMAQALGIPIQDARWSPTAVRAPSHQLKVDCGPRRIGSGGLGFTFDNELQAHLQHVDAFEIDSRPVTWGEFLPFVETGGYEESRWWSESGWDWRTANRATAPRYFTRSGQQWWQERFGTRVLVDLHDAACHLSLHEAQAWCRWSGRRLPTEVEWEIAAREEPGRFSWGQVWEWTASLFAPYPGFAPHPYVDYSQPWFGDRPVLRGASFGTQERMRDPRYRNFFPAHRNDIFAGFRTCKVNPS